MGSARIMAEVRRRLWEQASDPRTDSIQVDKIMARIRALCKRIEKRSFIEIQVADKSSLKQTIV